MSHKHCRAVVGTTLVLGLVFGCADQGEGERCDRLSGNEDCASGLVCIELELASGPIDRCCPPQGESVSDDRCIQRPVADQTGTAGSTGEPSSQGGDAGSSGAPSSTGGA